MFRSKFYWQIQLILCLEKKEKVEEEEEEEEE
jgi:hypothetical protein